MRAVRRLIAARPAAAVLLALACNGASATAIFQVDEADETIHLTDRPSDTSRLVAGEAAQRSDKPGGSTPFAEIVRRAAQLHGVAPELLHAVIATESAYAPRAVSRRGALGLMQLMPATASDYGVTDLFDPRQNVDAGARHLRRLLDMFDNDTSLALAAYNAGAAAVLRHGRRIPPFAETTAYVPRVLRTLARLRAAQSGS